MPCASIPAVKQPRGGYINPKRLVATEVEGPKPKLDQKQESINAILVGIAVDYLARFMNGAPANEAFHISLLSAAMVNEAVKALSLVESVTDLDDVSIVTACRLAGYDSVLRAGVTTFRSVESIVVDAPTCENIRKIVNLSLKFFSGVWPRHA